MTNKDDFRNIFLTLGVDLEAYIKSSFSFVLELLQNNTFRKGQRTAREVQTSQILFGPWKCHAVSPLRAHFWVQEGEESQHGFTKGQSCLA